MRGIKGLLFGGGYPDRDHPDRDYPDREYPDHGHPGWGGLDARPGHWCATDSGDEAISRLAGALRARDRRPGRPAGMPRAARRG